MRLLFPILGNYTWTWRSPTALSLGTSKYSFLHPWEKWCGVHVEDETPKGRDCSCLCSISLWTDQCFLSLLSVLVPTLSSNPIPFLLLPQEAPFPCEIPIRALRFGTDSYSTVSHLALGRHACILHVAELHVSTKVSLLLHTHHEFPSAPPVLVSLSSPVLVGSPCALQLQHAQSEEHPDSFQHK